MSQQFLSGHRGRFIASLCLLAFMCGLNTGCAAFAAARAPGKKDLSVLRPGTPRNMVVSELGPPTDVRQEPDGGSQEFYAFKQGYTKPVIASRAVAHWVLDVNTFCLWELVGSPTEAAWQGEDVRAQVTYNDRQQIQRVEYLAGAHLANGGPTLCPSWRRKSTQQTAVLEGPPRNQGATRQSSEVMQAGHQATSP